MAREQARYEVAIVSHVFANGPAQAMEQYFQRKGCRYLFIGHPFHKHPPQASFCLQAEADGSIRRTQALLLPIPEPYRHAIDFLVTLRWLLRFGPVDVVIGNGNLNALAGMVLRQFGKVQRVVFYAIDYVPVRFRQRSLNVLYRWMDRLCLRWSDWIWNLSPEMAEARAASGVPKQECAPQVIVPMGAGFDLARRVLPVKDAATVAFVGHHLDKQGVQVVLEAFPTVLRAIPEARFLVMGGGPYEAFLRALAARLGIEERVEFTGFVADFAVIQQRLAQSTIGVAIYLGELDRWTRYADPGKIKDYLAAALPVVTTAVPPIAQAIAEHGAGVVVEPTTAAVAQALTALLTDRTTWEHTSQAALRLAQRYDWDRVFDQAFQSSIGPVSCVE